MSDSLKEEESVMRHFQKVGFGLVIIFSSVISYLWAQNAAPQVYSYTEDPAISIMGPTIVKIVRDGPKEAVDQIMPVGPDRNKEFHNHILYDFQAHKIYTKLVSDPTVPCTVMNYTSSAAPPELDMISGAADAMKELQIQHAKQVGTETLNGIATRVLEATIEQGQEKLWVAQNGGFPVKVVLTGPDGKAMTIIEVKQLSFAKPPASALLPPTGCRAIQGEASAHGVRAELGTVASSVTAQTGGAQPAPGGPPGAQTNAKVTSAKLQVALDNSEPCKLSLFTTIETDGAGTLWWRFDSPPGVTYPFGGQEGSTDMRVSTSLMTGTSAKFTHDIRGQFKLEAAMKQPDGSRGPVTLSNIVPADFRCPAATAPAQSQMAPPPAQATQGGAPRARVTAVHLKVVPAEYSGVCPVKVQLEGTLTADGPGKAYFQFQAGAVGANREGTVEVSAAGTATVSSEGEVRRTPRVPSVRFLAGMEPRGHQENAKWTDVHLNISCTNAP
jgi:hypothetical protein